jgi:hypothetical protein
MLKRYSQYNNHDSAQQFVYINKHQEIIYSCKNNNKRYHMMWNIALKCKASCILTFNYEYDYLYCMTDKQTLNPRQKYSV